MSEDTTHLQRPVIPAADPTRPAVMIQIYGEGLGRRFELGSAQVDIGRSDECDVAVEMETISRQHCRVVARDGAHVVEDVGSTNGTLVNECPVTLPRRLVDGDLLTVGGAVFRYLGGENVEQLYFEEIHRLAIIDGLTQIANRRCFDEFLAREISRSGRRDHDLCLLLIDLDRFKRINDELGHVAGDSVLRHVARVIEALPIRKQDCLARYGGEEFALVLTDCALEDAVQIAERIRGSVQNASLHVDDHALEITVSIGVARLQAGQQCADFVEIADRALYEAKAAGRNRIHS